MRRHFNLLGSSRLILSTFFTFPLWLFTAVQKVTEKKSGIGSGCALLPFFFFYWGFYCDLPINHVFTSASRIKHGLVYSLCMRTHISGNTWVPSISVVLCFPFLKSHISSLLLVPLQCSCLQKEFSCKMRHLALFNVRNHRCCSHVFIFLLSRNVLWRFSFVYFPSVKTVVVTSIGWTFCSSKLRL